jgi:phosphatidylglycerol:prolipoprotein diacylglycerol transferase
MMYLVAFTITFLLFVYQIKHKEIDYTIDDTLTLFLYTIAGLILGARLFSALVYDGSTFYWTHPWLIFWPFRNGQFIGLPGMSYHGGMLGAIIGSWLFSRRYNRSFFQLADVLAAGIPLGYTFGRLGNFINGELWGRVSTVGWSMVFPDAPRFSTNYSWVRDIADKVGLSYTPGALVNLPRHPSQLYEACFEGVVLWLFLWLIIRKRKQFPGFILSWYIIGYGMIRFLIEYLREPDSNIGFVIAGGAQTEPLALFHSVLNISLGQILSLLMVAGGVTLLLLLTSRHKQLMSKQLNANSVKKRKK